jgi:predicted helicase
MQSVGLVFLCRALSDAPSVTYQELVGTRQYKYDRLSVDDAGNQTALVPNEANQWLFQPLGVDAKPEWSEWPRIDQVFLEWGAGVKTNRDGLAVGFSSNEVESQIRDFADLKRTDAEVEGKYSFKSNYQWKTEVVRKKFAREGFVDALVEPYAHRPFDVRFVYWHPSIVFNMRGDKMECFRSAKPPVALLFARNTTKPSYTNFFVTRSITDIHCLETMNVAPLFAGAKGRRGENVLDLAAAPLLNLDKAFCRALSRRLGLPEAAQSDASIGLSAEDIFQYVYAVFYSPGYRARYAEFLKLDFPRLPLAGSMGLFRRLSRLGDELVALHLLESTKLNYSISEYVGGRAPEVERVSWSSNTVWLDKAHTTGFRGVREEVWNFYIGGYQVCEKWLKDRKGRMLSKADIAHYQKVIVALSETIRLMKEIDDVIEQHGGWPNAFRSNS